MSVGKSQVRIGAFGIALVLAVGALAGATANAAGLAPVGLGSAESFAVLAGTPAVTNTGPSVIAGDLGIHPGAAVTGFPPGLVSGGIHKADALALQAKSDLVLAYDDAAGRTGATTVVGGTLGGKTLVGGVYNSGGATLGLTGTVTLNGQNNPDSVWIFQATSDLITASSSTVAFINGAQPCNVFWQVTSSATLGSGSTFVGTILALTSITMANGVSLSGRALARNGNVTLINDTITTSSCGGAPEAPEPRERFVAAPVPAPSMTPAPAATPAPTVAPIATPAPIAAPIVTPTTSPAVRGVQTLPSTSTLDRSDPLAVVGVVLIAIGALVLRSRRPAPTVR